MRLLITRPREDAETISKVLRARGHATVTAPLMEVHVHDGPSLSLEGVQAVLATSANGVRALAKRTPRRDLALYAVGPQTAETARAEGFTSVHSADGDSATLVDLVAGQCDAARGTLFHAAGAETAGRLRQALQARGFSVEARVLYDAEPVTVLPAPAAEALRGNALDGVLVFSPRSAKILAARVAEAGLADRCRRLHAFCISAATASALNPLAFAKVSVAGRPDQDAIIALIPDPAA